jgi:hypothetical protein
MPAGRAGRWWSAVVGRGPFGTLVVVNAVSAAADAAFTVSLAGSLFISVSVDAARPRILLYLVCTLAPFAVVGERAIRHEPTRRGAGGAGDEVDALVALAHAMRAQGAAGPAVLTAGEAVRVAGARRGAGEDGLPPELAVLWRHVAEGGVASDADVASAIALAEEARDAGHQGATRLNGPRPAVSWQGPPPTNSRRRSELTA